MRKKSPCAKHKDPDVVDLATRRTTAISPANHIGSDPCSTHCVQANIVAGSLDAASLAQVQLIEAATGMNEQQFRALKQRLEGTAS